MKRIAYIQYANPALYPPLEHSSQILASNGWQVLFLGTGALAADANAMRLADFPGIRVRQLGYCPPGWRQKLHYIWYAAWATCWVLAWRPAWVYVSDLLACPVGLLLSYLPFLRVIYHEHDSPGLSDARSGFITFTLWTRKKLAQRVEMRVLPNQQRLERFTSEMGNGVTTTCVWNCPMTNEVSSPRAAVDGERFWVLYHGTIVPARLPLAVIEALCLLPDRLGLRVVGYETIGHPGYSRTLLETAEKLRVAHRLDLRNAVPRQHLFEVCRHCDIGLALMPGNSTDMNEQNMTGASNKAFDYLACGLPMLVSDLPDWRKMYVDAGVALACDPGDPASIAAALRWFLDHPEEMRAMGERGRKRILAEWNYEAQFAPVLSRLGTRAGTPFRPSVH
jgi:glycosyltransferase involved in cell wall biosynthesis